MDYIPLTDCKHGYLYKINSRNLGLGVFNSKDNGFIGIRYKFGDRYLFTEEHWDTGAPYGTVKPLKEIEKVPDDLIISELECHEWGCDWANNPITNQVEPVIRHKLQPNESQHGKRIDFVDEWAKDKTRLPDNLYPFLKGNTKMFEYLDKFKKLSD